MSWFLSHKEIVFGRLKLYRIGKYSRTTIDHFHNIYHEKGKKGEIERVQVIIIKKELKKQPLAHYYNYLVKNISSLV